MKVRVIGYLRDGSSKSGGDAGRAQALTSSREVPCSDHIEKIPLVGSGEEAKRWWGGRKKEKGRKNSNLSAPHRSDRALVV